MKNNLTAQNSSPARWEQTFEQWVRGIAQKNSRRGFLGRLGTLLVGASAYPLLPVARAAAPARQPTPDEALIDGSQGDPSSCDYWRHCAIDGYACSCCGGSQNTCPPGTEMSTVTWVGTCRNPSDNKDYIISYNDCCGKSSCGRCLCTRSEGDKAIYYPAKSNDINWCMGTSSNVYHCSTAIIIGSTE